MIFFEIIGIIVTILIAALVAAYATGFVSFERGVVEVEDEEKVH